MINKEWMEASFQSYAVFFPPNYAVCVVFHPDGAIIHPEAFYVAQYKLKLKQDRLKLKLKTLNQLHYHHIVERIQWAKF